MSAEGRRVGLCQVGGHWVPYRDLRRQYREWCEPIGSNYCLYSSYNSAFWTCSSASAGEISIGPFYGYAPNIMRASPFTVTNMGGSQTWTATGTIRSNVAIDGSTWTRFTSGCVVGPYQVPTASALYTAVIGICNSGGTPITVEKTYTNERGSRHIWFTKDIADIAAPSTLYFYVTVTVASASEKWYADMFRCERDVSVPTVFLTTRGAAKRYTQPTLVSGMATVCPKHTMPVRDRWTKEHPHEEPVDPIPTDGDFRTGGTY